MQQVLYVSDVLSNASRNCVKVPGKYYRQTATCTSCRRVNFSMSTLRKSVSGCVLWTDTTCVFFLDLGKIGRLPVCCYGPCWIACCSSLTMATV